MGLGSAFLMLNSTSISHSEVPVHHTQGESSQDVNVEPRSYLKSQWQSTD